MQPHARRKKKRALTYLKSVLFILFLCYFALIIIIIITIFVCLRE